MVYLAAGLTMASVTVSPLVKGISLLSPPYLTGTCSGEMYLFSNQQTYELSDKKERYFNYEMVKSTY